MSKMKEYLLDQYEQEITPEIDDLIKMKEEELSQALTNLLDTANTKEREGDNEYKPNKP